ncbi:hypothetical protein MHU86_5025 [Fragilaria crotonensis]|nr:hypothetical protein MHU86_5025 [Fragilaria crotonensis]
MGLSLLPSPAVPAALLLLLLTMATTVSPFVMSPHPSHQSCREGTSHRLPHAFVAALPHQPLFVAPERMDCNSIPDCITSSVLKQVYPSLLQWREEYGHPNIPLGTPEGRMCQTLRRLQIQQKLTDTEIQLLHDIDFRFSSLEDVYHELDFNVMLTKLIAYEQQEQNQYQVPKKYAPDPELGAWVTGIRRVYAANKNLQQGVVDPHHMERLDAIGFTWISERKCGSKFMSQYRELVSQLDAAAAAASAADDEVLTMKRDEILKQEKVQTWIAAQRDARRRGGLSDTRFHYMQQLLGDDWMDE